MATQDSFYPTIEIKDRLEAPRSSIDIWLDKLAMKESGGNCTVSIIDTNGRRSTGLYQYQDATWLNMGKKYGLPTTLENITDCHMQRTLTFLIITQEPNGWKNWFCSVQGCEKWNIKGIGLPPRYDVL
jgi:hypothetical protein